MKTLFALLFLILAAASPLAGADYSPWVPEFTAATADGSVAKGAHGVIFILSSDFAGTILGTTVTGATLPGNRVEFTVTNDHVLPAIAYTRTAGTLWIMAVR